MKIRVKQPREMKENSKKGEQKRRVEGNGETRSKYIIYLYENVPLGPY